MKLTEHGELLDESVREVMTLLAAAEARLTDLRDEPRGSLRTSCDPAFGSFWLAPRPAEFASAYPEISLVLRLDGGDADLAMGEADAAISMSLPRRSGVIQPIYRHRRRSTSLCRDASCPCPARAGRCTPRRFSRPFRSFREEEKLMYHETILQICRSFEAIDGWLDKAERHAAETKSDIGVLMNGRLAPDMRPFIYQVQSASDYLKGGAAWLARQEPPRYEDTEKTIDEVRMRIRKTVDFVRGIAAEQYTGAREQRVGVSWSPPGKVASGEVYLLQVILPNTYFHIAIAYAILRHHGVNIGKMDFLGPINWTDA